MGSKQMPRELERVRVLAVDDALEPEENPVRAGPAEPAVRPAAERDRRGAGPAGSGGDVV